MTKLDGGDPPGATPLDPDDLDGLLPTWVATRGDLNVVEQANIEKATRWAHGRRPRIAMKDMFSYSFSIDVHKKMFGDVWRWAGERRPRETSIGIDPLQIPAEMKMLLDDAHFWHEHTTYEPHELAVRLHHRMVFVHPFRNGNGRHSRFIADLYLYETRQKALSWGAGEDLVLDGDARDRYIAALSAADAGDLAPLIKFARVSRSRGFTGGR